MKLAIVQSRNISLVHPAHALLLAFPIAMFTGALIADITYLNSAQIQWTNFAAWLITGALLFGAPVLLWAAISLFSRRRSFRPAAGIYLLLLVIMWSCGLMNAFNHSRDGWSSVGSLGLILSIVSTLTALFAGWIAYSGERSRV